MKTYKTRPFNRDGSPAQTAALERQLRGLVDLEQTEVYRDMCAAATERRRAEEALPRQQNGKLLARASATPDEAPRPPRESASSGVGGAQGDRRLQGSRVVQVPPTSEAMA